MKLTLFWSQKRMAACFDFRMRTSSFDLHQLAQRRKLAKFSKLFRSKSEGSVRVDSPKSSPKTSPKASPKGSPKGSPTAVTRRRFVRVVKDNEAAGEEYDNPHIIRRYTQEYLQEQWAQKSADTFDEDNLPYIVSGHTILKKHASGDRTESPTGDQSPMQKHASFKDEVQVIEFDKKGKVKACSICMTVARLQDSDEEGDTTDICEMCLRKGIEDCQHLSSESENSDSESRDTITDKPDSKASSSDNNNKDGPNKDRDNSVSEKKTDSHSIVTKLVSEHIELQESERLRGIPTLVSADG